MNIRKEEEKIGNQLHQKIQRMGNNSFQKPLSNTVRLNNWVYGINESNCSTSMPKRNINQEFQNDENYLQSIDEGDSTCNIIRYLK